MDVKAELALKELRQLLGDWRLWTIILGCCAVALGLPLGAAAFLGIVELRSRIRPWLGVAAIVSGVGLAVCTAESIRSTVAVRRLNKSRLKVLGSLSPDQKAFLYQYIEQGTKTQYVDTQDGVARGLVAEGIIFVPSQIYNILMGMAFNLHTWAWDYFHDHPELLNVSMEEQDQLRRLAEKAAKQRRW